MKATIGIEAIESPDKEYLDFGRWLCNNVLDGLGDVTVGKAPAPYWVAEITGFDPKYRYARRFINGKKNYDKSNGAGTRGVYVWYLLESGHIYEVKAPTSWTREERYFCRVTDEGDVVRISKEEVDEWIKRCSASTC